MFRKIILKFKMSVRRISLKYLSTEIIKDLALTYYSEKVVSEGEGPG
jgi:hypothetical protein